MRSRSPLFLAVISGLVGLLVGGIGGMFGSLWIATGGLPRDGAGVAGEYAAPYGFLGGLLGLAIGAWAGHRMGKRRGSR